MRRSSYAKRLYSVHGLGIVDGRIIDTESVDHESNCGYHFTYLFPPYINGVL